MTTIQLSKGLAIGAAFCVAAMVSSPSDAATLDDVKAKGKFACGVSQGLPGFSQIDDNDEWTGIDVEFCRAVAAAIFDDTSAVDFVPTSAKERFTALQSGEIDILSRNTTWTMQRDTALGLNFVGTLYYDGQGFMARKKLGVDSAHALDGAAICTNTGTTTELNAVDFFRSNGMDYDLVAFEKTDEAVQAYDSGRCDVYTTDASGLYANRLKLTNPDEHMVLPEIISKEPLGPVVRQGDDQWYNINRWVLHAMINAEELGVTSGNIDSMMTSKNPSVLRLLGVEGSFGEKIGLDNKWAYRVIKHVGNYSEVFDRWVGPSTPLAIARGVNALWTDGGILYAPPIR
jgi:general L-amino acid transport system substrate-binding protein